MCDVKFQIYIQNMAASYEAAILSDSTKRLSDVVVMEVADEVDCQLLWLIVCVVK